MGMFTSGIPSPKELPSCSHHSLRRRSGLLREFGEFERNIIERSKADRWNTLCLHFTTSILHAATSKGLSTISTYLTASPDTLAFGPSEINSCISACRLHCTIGNMRTKVDLITQSLICDLVDIRNTAQRENVTTNRKSIRPPPTRCSCGGTALGIQGR